MELQILLSNGESQLAEVTSAAVTPAAQAKQDKLYKAEYIGSGTFIISKPKRKKIKMRQTQLKNPKRGSRK
jgi:hypothetical protein